MSPIKLPVRYCQLDVDPDVEWEERNFHLKDIVWKIAPRDAALVMVDVWDIHPYASHMERSARITEERIAPLAEVCRTAGIAVIHAPSPGQAVKYRQWVRYAGDREISGTGAGAVDDWPPPEFRQRSGKYAKLAKPKSSRREKWVKEDLPNRKIMACMEPQPDDFVIANGDQLHRLLKHRKILHLFYAGFAANMCMLHRDYGICAMQRRGYNVILLSDCTTAIESGQTLEDMAHTRASVSIVEMVFGVSTTSDELLSACTQAKPRKAKKSQAKTRGRR